MAPRTDNVKRFWNSVDIKGPDECWEWRAYRNKCGYGVFTLYEGFKKYSRQLANRLALKFSGVEQTAPCALHKCDNPPCCNPNHLYWGTRLENSDDLRKRNHRYMEALRHRAKLISVKLRALLPSQVDYIKQLLAAGYSISDCASWYCVQKQTIARIKSGKTYRNSAKELNSAQVAA